MEEQSEEIYTALCKFIFSVFGTQVKVKNVISDEIELKTEVGEGSILAPNFFSCGMTDISIVARRVMKELK